MAIQTCVSFVITMLNSEIKRLTIEELKTFEGYENYTDEEAQKTIDTIVTFSIIMFNIYNDEKSKHDAAANTI